MQNPSAAPAEAQPDPALKQRQQAGRHLVLSLFSGLLLALAFSTHATAWLVWVALVPWFYVLYSQPLTWGRGAFQGWIFGIAFYIGVIHWLKELHPLTWLQGVTENTSLLIVYSGILGIPLVVSLWTLLLGGILGWLKPTGFRLVLYPALLWMLMESAQALGEVSLPWARLAVSQYQNLWLLQIVPHTGQLTVSFLIVAFNAALAWFLLQFVPEPKPQPYWHYAGFRAMLVVLGLVGACLSYGFWRLQQAPEVAELFEGDTYVAVMQGNIPQDQKWTTPEEYWENMYRILAIYQDLSQQALQLRGENTASLLIWPESALPLVLGRAPAFQQAFEDLARQGQTHLLSGIFTQSQQETIFNSAMLVEPDGRLEQIYYKRQLVPFGEFFPYREALIQVPVLGGLIEKLNPMRSDTARGTEPALFETPFARIGSLICFESVYPHVARESVRAGANLLVVVTNDGWYRDAIALYQHLGHAVLRALENDRLLLRAGNTGISALVDGYGRIHKQTLPMEREFLSWHIKSQDLKTQQTLYTRFGDWPLWLAGLLLLGLELSRRLKRQTATD